MQRLGIVSDCIHFKSADGKIGTENHILLQQLQALAKHFTSVFICCPFVAYNDKMVASYYTDERISFIRVPNVGGETLKAKLEILTVIPKWLAAFRKIDRQSDIVYQRFPNNLNIPGFYYFYYKKKKVFATFTGTWEDYKGEAGTYFFQKKLLRTKFRGPVWAYLNKPSDNPRIHAGISPSYSKKVWDDETAQVEQRIQKLTASPLQALRMITVGSFVANKNQQQILDACLLLRKSNIPFTLTLVGDGALKAQYAAFIKDNDLGNEIVIAGKKTSIELRDLYRNHDFIVQAPIREGFGKVPVEGFFHGLVPVLSDVELARVMTADNQRGYIFTRNDVDSLFTILRHVFQNQSILPAQISAGRAYAAAQTLESWAQEYADVVTAFYR